MPVIGGGKRIRTADPLRARQVLSQLSYTPKTGIVQGSRSSLGPSPDPDATGLRGRPYGSLSWWA